MAQPQPPQTKSELDRAIRKRRWQFVAQTSQMLELPMIVLAFVWLGLVVYGLSVPEHSKEVNGLLASIWYIFVGEFLLRAFVAPNKREFLKHNWLGALSLLVPFLRVFQIFNAIATLQQITALASGNSVLLLVLSSINRSMSALHKLLRRRGTGYIVTLTLIVIFAGAAGILSSEKNVVAANGIHDYPTALYWTSMLLTTIGCDYWPQTPQGKLLCLVLSCYALAILGYIAATLASFFIGRDAFDDDGELASDRQVRELKQQIALLQQELRDCMGPEKQNRS
jgi:voltage-gated potassium channel